MILRAQEVDKLLHNLISVFNKECFKKIQSYQDVRQVGLNQLLFQVQCTYLKKIIFIFILNMLY
jgi:hypothetical protein